METYKKIEGFENYSVSDQGRVRNDLTGRILKLRQKKDGYLMAQIIKEGKKKAYYIHRLVAEVFLPNPENKPQINHKNGIKIDNRLENLEWCTRLENMKHAYSTGLIPGNKGITHGRSKLTNEKVLEIRRLRAEGWLQDKLAEKFGVSLSVISKIEHKKSWTHI